MDLDWMNALGAAFIDQPDDVFKAIQALREQAEAAGILKDTPQQQVVEEGEVIRIVPAEKEVIYVPQYDPQIIYVEEDDDSDEIAAAVIGFGVGLAMGAWLDNDCDWVHYHVVGCRPGYWGGWGWHGSINWDNDWYAVRGPRRGFVKGDDRGIAWGPNGRAVWGENGGAVWRRPTYASRPVYTGRYGNYRHISNRSVRNVGNRRTNISGNTFNRNNVNVNIDRGRTNLRGGSRTNIGSNNRTYDMRRSTRNNNSGNIGGRTDNRIQNNRTTKNRASNSRTTNNRMSRPTTNRTARPQTQRRSHESAFHSNHSRREIQRHSNRGMSSRKAVRGRRR